MRLRNHTNYIVIHSAATKPSFNGGIEDIDRWHRDRGFDMVGYHYVITRDGAIQHGRDLAVMGAHAKGHNHESIGICLIGGVNDDMDAEFNFTRQQLAALEDVLNDMLAVYYNAEVIGHRDIMADGHTKCPSFNVGAWWDAP